MSSPLSMIYEFGRFRLDRGNQRLTRDGLLVPTPGKTLPILIDLIANRAEVMPVEKLVKNHFARSEYAEEELTGEILKLKRVLEDNSKTEPMIRYLFGEGYRFETAVTEFLGDANNGTDFKNESAAAGEALPPAPEKTNTVLKAIGVATAIIVAAILGGGVWHYYAGSTVGASSNVEGGYTGPPQIAVLPIQSLSGQKNDNSFNAAFYDALCAALGTQAGVRVVPKEQVQQYVESGATDPVTAGHQLGAQFIVHTVAGQLFGKALVKVQLLNTRDGSQAWIGSFEGKSSDNPGRLASRISPQVAAAATQTETSQ